MPSLYSVLLAHTQVRHQEPDDGEQLTAVTQLLGVEVAPALVRRVGEHLRPHDLDHAPPLVRLQLQQRLGQPAGVEQHRFAPVPLHVSRRDLAVHVEQHTRRSVLVPLRHPPSEEILGLRTSVAEPYLPDAFRQHEEARDKREKHVIRYCSADLNVLSNLDVVFVIDVGVEAEVCGYVPEGMLSSNSSRAPCSSPCIGEPTARCDC
jgi:hypothetical protein